MKNIYLKAGKTEDVFNDLKDNFNGILTSNNEEYNLAFNSKAAKGTIKGITFPDGITYMQFDMYFYEEVRLSMESLKTSPIFFVYGSQGNIQHSFGEQGEKKNIRKQQTGILKSTSSVNNMLHFEKQVPVVFHLIQVGINTVTANEHHAALVKKLKNTFFNTKEDYMEVGAQSAYIAKKIKELNGLTHKGVVRNLFINRIVEKMIEIEIEQHTDGFSLMAASIHSYAVQQIEEVKRKSELVASLSSEILTTDFLIQKAASFSNKMQREFKLLLSRSVHDLLIFMRIERGRV